MEAGKLNHRIDIDERVTVQDTTGDPVVTWTPWATNVPANIEYTQGKEFYGQNILLGQVVGRITIRYRPGLVPTMRIRHGTTVYNIAGILPDSKSGRDHIIMPVSAGVNDG